MPRYSRKRKPATGIPEIYGQGGYWQRVKDIAKEIVPKGTFRKLGNMGGFALGGALTGHPGAAVAGGSIGGMLGQSLANIAGFGAYNVSSNSLTSGIQEGVGVPQFDSNRHVTIIRHREYVGTVTNTLGTTAFQLSKYAINPGMSATFPWLSNVAPSFDSYQILGAVAEFRSTSSDSNATGGGLGSVVMTTNYDVADNDFTSVVQMENGEYSVSAKPSDDQVLIFECDPTLTFAPIKYIRSGPVPSGRDSRLYDFANMYIAVNGNPASAGTQLGELWITYEIALYKPQLIGILGTVCDSFSLPTTITSSAYLAGSTTTTLSPNSGSTLLGSCLGSTYTFPTTVVVGERYLIQLSYFGTTYTQTNALTISRTGLTALNYFDDTSAATSALTAPPAASTSQTTCIYITTQQIASVPASFTVTAGTLPGSPVGDLFITRLPTFVSA